MAPERSRGSAALRGTGGSVLAYGILTVTNGALKLERFGSIYDLDIPRGGIPVGASRDLTTDGSRWFRRGAFSDTA